MTRLFKAALLLFLLGSAFTVAGAQSGAVIPQGGAGHANQASCVILKRMGPADEVTSHLYSFGFRGKQFQYIEGELPEGFPFHGRLTDHDVRDLQGRGAEVLFLEPHYTEQGLKEARAECNKMTGKSPNQTPESPSMPDPSAQPAAAQLAISSVPDGADIEIDGGFVGNTPSSIDATSGGHVVIIRKKGFKDWQRKVKVSGGSITLRAELDPAQ